MFDVIVVGGGHAGAEAAAAAARMGVRVALVTHRAHLLGAMSCNPAIGGLGKGHLVREVDAFDGLIGRASDAAAIHYRMLNRSKGPAVHGPRIQADRQRYAAAIRAMLAGYPNLLIVEGECAALAFDREAVVGIVLADSVTLRSRTVVLASGTFLAARLFHGSTAALGGRRGEPSAVTLAAQLRALGLPMGRLKTGTPPRLDGRTIDWSRLARQPSDLQPWTMSPLGRRHLPQLACAITRTNPVTHDVIRDGLVNSPLTRGEIVGGGPRYCPSVEDKIVRFGDRDGHQVFLEPEGLDVTTVYPNGLSTSLSAQTQAAMIGSIAGLEKAMIVAPGYAVEYDYLDPRALDHRLALGVCPGLFCAGQLNGTTGYEEAAGQGLIAGLNAAAQALDRDPIVVDRDQGYLGVMIDDLVLQGVTEPYRMLTSRAESRLVLRADNAATRLTPLALKAGCVEPDRVAHFAARTAARNACLAGDPCDDPAVADEVALDLHYRPYVERQAAELRAVRSADELALPAGAWRTNAGLSTEMMQRLTAANPKTLGEARRVRGITPAALASLMIAARQRDRV